MSVALHLLLVALLLLFVRSRPADPDANPVGTVELLLVEKRGSGKPIAPSRPDLKPPTASTPAPPPPAAAKPTPPAPPAVAAPAPPPLSDPAGEPVPLTAQTTPQPSKPVETPPPVPAPPPPEAKVAQRPPPPPPAQPQPQEAPVFNLEGTDSESNAIALGEHIIPASPDDRFRNRPPVYPYEAAARGEHGAVVVIIHVSANGMSTGADVVATSGVASLDQAALDAVRKWHFQPAMKDGRAIPFDMPMRFIFESE